MLSVLLLFGLIPAGFLLSGAGNEDPLDDPGEDGSDFSDQATDLPQTMPLPDPDGGPGPSYAAPVQGAAGGDLLDLALQGTGDTGTPEGEAADLPEVTMLDMAFDSQDTDQPEWIDVDGQAFPAAQADGARPGPGMSGATDLQEAEDEGPAEDTAAASAGPDGPGGDPAPDRSGPAFFDDGPARPEAIGWSGENGADMDEDLPADSSQARGFNLPAGVSEALVPGFVAGSDLLEIEIGTPDVEAFLSRDPVTGDAQLRLFDDTSERLVTFTGYERAPVEDIFLTYTNPQTGEESSMALNDVLFDEAKALDPISPETRSVLVPGPVDGPVLDPLDPGLPSVLTPGTGESGLDPVEPMGRLAARA